MVYYPGRTETDHGGWGRWKSTKTLREFYRCETAMKIQDNIILYTN